MLRDAIEEVICPAFDRLAASLNALAGECIDIPMLARTHGQPASPTTLGKELGVFSYRLSVQRDGNRPEIP